MAFALPSGIELVALKDRVLKGFGESEWKELGALTNTLDYVTGHDRLLRSLSWHDDDYEGHVLTALKKIIDSSPLNYAIVQDYICLKCPEVGEFVSSKDEGGRRILFTPLVFKTPTVNVNPHLISVMMPFKAELTDIYAAIKKAAESAGFSCMRADDLWNDSTVIQDIFSLIFESYIVVCDFSDRNENVFYEAGIAHTLGKHVVPITQSADDIPFDLRHHRYAKYLNNSEGRAALAANLTERFTVLLLLELESRAGWVSLT